MSVPTSDLTGSFWIAMGTMVFAFFGLIVRYGYKSKCKEVSCCCFHVQRDTEDEIKEDLAELGANKASLEIPPSPKNTSNV
jgi:hypothetical protein